MSIDVYQAENMLLSIPEEGRYKDFSIGTAEKAIVETIKEKVCYVSVDFERDLQRGVPDLSKINKNVNKGAKRYSSMDMIK